MIDSAVKILGPVPAANIDPQLLIQSQTSETSGYVMISYPFEAENLTYDLMLFKSNQVLGSFRMTPDLRFVLDAATIVQKFRVHKSDSAVSVSLYLASIELLKKFQDTFHFAPSLKLKPDGLTRKQILSAAKAARIEHGYLELNNFADPSDPRVAILDVNRAGKTISQVLRRFTTAQLKASNCLLLYDVDKNRNAFQQGPPHPSPVLGEGLGEGGSRGNNETSLDSILESILASSTEHVEPRQNPMAPPVRQEELRIDSSPQSIEEEQPQPAKPASPQLIALFAELRSALIALLGRARAARSLNRALTSSSPTEASNLRKSVESDPDAGQPAIATEEDAKVLIRCIIDIPKHLILNKRKAREKLARILADRYSQDYAAFAPDELEFLESLWKKLTK